MLTGMTPFRGANGFEILRKHQSEPPPPPRTFAPDLSPAVEALVLQALAKRPELRFQSMAEMRAAVRAIAASATGRRKIPGVELPTGPGTPTQVRAVVRAPEAADDAIETPRRSEPHVDTQVAPAPVPFIETERVPEMPAPAAGSEVAWMPEPTGPSGPATFSSVFSDTATGTHALRARGRLLKGVTVGLALAAGIATIIVVFSLGSDGASDAPRPAVPAAPAPTATHPAVPPAPEPTPVEPRIEPQGLGTVKVSAPDPAPDPAPETHGDTGIESPEVAEPEVAEPDPTPTPSEPVRPGTSPKPKPALTDDTVKRKLVRRAKTRCAGLGTGRVEVSFSIKSEGDVMLVDARSPHADDELGRCVEGVVTGARFPRGTLRRESIVVRW
jgi:hypothetical protein